MIARGTVLVTGGAGFLGAPLTAGLINSGWDVVVLDNFSVSRRNRLALLDASVRVEAVDLRDRDAVIDAVSRNRPDACIHLAALHYIPACVADPAVALAINVLGTQHLLDALERLGYPVHIVFASTADVYEPAEGPHCEDARTTPDNVYGLSKRTGEQLLTFYSRRSGSPVLILRLFNMYGPGETNPHVIPTIVEQLHRGTRLTLGNMEARRDYVFVDDVADLICSLVGRPGPAGLFNVGTGESHSVRQVVDELSCLLGVHIEVTSDPLRVRPSDRPNLQAAVGSLRQVAPRWRPRALREGLRCLLEAEGLLAASESIG